MQSKFVKSYLLAFVTIGFYACNNSTPEKETTPIDTLKTTESVAPMNTGKYEMVISDIPFPFEILENLNKYKVPFNSKAMNDVSNCSKYTSYNLKALNLGIYGADLSYTVTNEQFQQMGTYVKTTKKLAEDLNIPLAFDKDMMDKYDKFKDNKDSLKRIVYDSYNKVDKALKDDELVGVAALVVTGSWLEGLYISTKTFLDIPKTKDNVDLYKIINDQKTSLIIVIKLLDEYKKDAYFAGIIKDLKDITSAYDKVSADNTINEKGLIDINKKVEKLRNRIADGVQAVF